MTTSDITKTALIELDWRGFECWRQNQIHVPGRTFTGKLGLSDIIGFQRKPQTVNESGPQRKPQTGILLLCEVKNFGDVLSEDQIALLDLAKLSGAFCFIATVDKFGKFILKEY